MKTIDIRDVLDQLGYDIQLVNNMIGSYPGPKTARYMLTREGTFMWWIFPLEERNHKGELKYFCFYTDMNKNIISGTNDFRQGWSIEDQVKLLKQKS